MTQQTVGSKALELQSKGDQEINAIDLQREIHKEKWENDFRECFDRGKRRFDGDFFVVVLFKKERLLHNVVRQYFIDRQSCPTPEWDQTVFHYHRESDELEFLWCVPDHTTCKALIQNKDELSLEQIPLLQYVQAFYSGQLDKETQKRNKEFQLTTSL